VKLVRDNIPEIIENTGKWCLCKSVRGDAEHIVMLEEKMKEEIKELISDPCYEEAADVYEVFLGLINFYNLNLDEVIKTAEKKRKERGGFEKGIILESVGEK
jgi:predicted house-cleaning noncanonical NTP pyrophosphatase (MazG superfamily)